MPGHVAMIFWLNYNLVETYSIILKHFEEISWNKI